MIEFLRRALPRLGLVALPMLLAACAGLHFPLDAPGAAASAASTPATPGLLKRVLQWGDRREDAVAAPEAAASAPPAAEPAYVIGPEDGLDISVWKDDALKAATLVQPDGGISFPLIGDVMAAGRTAEQLRDDIARRLEKYIPEPIVTVSVVRIASYRIYVLGRVNKPGDFAAGRTLDVLQALSLAGGMTPFADEDEIRIIRKVDGKSVSLPFQYSRVRKEGDLSQNITLRSGDVLLVP